MAKRTGSGGASEAAPESSGEKTGFGVNFPVETAALARAVAFARAKKHGGRASVSALLVNLVERHRVELEKEGGRYLPMFLD